MTTNGRPKVAETKQNKQVLPGHDPFHNWMLFFLNTSTRLQHGRLSIYARILSRIRHRKSDAFSSMAVGLRHGQYTLLYNPSWAKGASYLEFVAVLAHEAVHIILRHIPRSARRIAAIPKKDWKDAHHVMNMAADAVVNEMISRHFPHIKTGVSGPWILPERLGLPKKSDMLTLFEIMWSYRHALIQRAKEIVQERKDARDQEQREKESGEGDGGESGQPQASGEGDGGGAGQSQPSNAPGKSAAQPGRGSQPIGDEAFEAQAQALADYMENPPHQWLIKDAEGDGDGEGSGEVETGPITELDAEELEATATLAEEEAKKIVANAIRQHEKSRGIVPNDLKSILDVLLEESVVPWSTLLRKLVTAKLLSKKRSTMDRPHKRRHILFYEDEDTGEIKKMEQPLPQYPGTRRNRTYVCLFAIDTSGSMSTTDLIEGLSEMQGILDAYDDAHLITVQCDTHITSVDVIGPNMDVEKYVKEIGRTSRGGTSFKAPFQLAQFMLKEAHPPPLPKPEETLRMLSEYRHVDMIIYHTDGYAPQPPEAVRPTCPTIWLVTENARTFHLSFGKVIRRTS